MEATVARLAMETKSNWAHDGIMFWWILLAGLAAWGIVATVWAVRVDGLRSVPNAPIARRRNRG